jgi:hypothetical protein
MGMQWTTEAGIRYSNGIYRDFLKKEISQKKKDKFLEIYNLLNYDNTEVLQFGYDLIDACILKGKIEIIVSQTGENEILIFTDIEYLYRNIVINNEGFIGYMYIPLERKNTYSESYSLAKRDYTIDDLVSKL